jgi:hypothetical protein
VLELVAPVYAKPEQECGLHPYAAIHRHYQIYNMQSSQHDGQDARYASRVTQSLAELQQMVREHEDALSKVGGPHIKKFLMAHLLTRLKAA